MSNSYRVEHYEPAWHGGGDWYEIGQSEPTDDTSIDPDKAEALHNWTNVFDQVQQDGGGIFRLVLETAEGDRQVSEEVTIGDADPESILKARGLDRWPDEPLTTADLPGGDR